MAYGRQKIGLGLDIGNYAVKMIEIAVPEGRPSLSAAGMKKVQNATSEGVIDSIKELITEAGIQSKEVAISVSGPSVIVRFIVMPKMTEVDLKKAIRFEAERHIPFNIGECVIDHHVIRRKRNDNKQDVILVAAKKDLVAGRVRIAEAAGLSVRVVDVDEFAVANSFMANFPDFNRENTIALLDIGSKLTNLSIICDGSVLFVRDIGIGSRDFAASIAKHFGVDARTAEEIMITPGGKEAEVVICTRAVGNNLCDDVKLSFGYYENQCGKGIGEVYLSGGGASFKGLEKQFQEILGLKPVLWNPLQFLDTGSARTDFRSIDSVKGYFAVASGLALR